MGFGNPVRSDDAVGIYVIEQLREKLPDSDDISIIDMGTAAFEVLFGLKGHDKIILADAVLNSNEPVGTLFKVPAEEVMKAPQDDPMVLKKAKAFKKTLETMTIYIEEDSLILGNQASSNFAAPIFPEYSGFPPG